MCHGEDTEEDREGHSKSEVRGILPQSVAGLGGHVAIGSRSGVGAGARGASVDW